MQKLRGLEAYGSYETKCSIKIGNNKNIAKNNKRFCTQNEGWFY